MSTELMDELEQAERVRAWLRENGGSIVTGIAIGVAALFGWNWWQQNQTEQRFAAASQYESLSQAVERGDAETVATLAQQLTAEFGATPYATLAQLQQAELQVQAGETAAARDTLQAALAEAGEPALADLARVRLARVLNALGEYDAVLAQLDAMTTTGYAAAAAELRGDALIALGRRDEAQAAYLAAVEALDPTVPNRRLLEMKLIDAGGTPPDTEGQA